jgi:acetoacetyl-CoA synthetase
MAPVRQGEVLWTPPPDARANSEIGRFMDFVRDTRGHEFADYEALWNWSIDDLEDFWGAIWDFYEIQAHTPYEQVLTTREMPDAKWFTGATLNYAEHMVGRDEDLDRVAIVGVSQTRPRVELTFAEFREQIARARAGLKRLGVGPGDRVAAYMPNVPETIIAFAATASLGAIWASCAPEFGSRSVVSRFGQIEPKVLLAVSGYTYGEKPIDRRPEVAAIREEVPSIEHVVHLP